MTASLTQLADAVRRVARPECIKPLRARDSEITLLLEHLHAAAATLDRLSREKAAHDAIQR